MGSSNGHKTLAVGKVIWREDLYPRFNSDAETILRYAESLEQLPPITVNQRGELIDGYHRWTAHKKVGVAEVPVTVTETKSDAHLLELAIESNAKHGLQLKREEKRNLAVKLYSTGQVKDKKRLQNMLGIGKSALAEWLQDTDRAERERRDQRIRDMWLACYTQEEIAEAVELDQRSIGRKIQELGNFPNLEKRLKVRALHEEDDWKPPFSDIWSFTSNSNTTTHFGNTDGRILDNLLYLYTEPFDIVVDPCVGGGTTIDVCKNRSRRYWVSDRLPVIERGDIRQHDIADGPPPLNRRWSEVSLVYLDPPYWKQAEGRYSTDPEDLANMSLEDFYTTLVTFIRGCASKMPGGSTIALIIQPTQWKAPNREVVDHIIDLIMRVDNKKVQYKRRFSCPLSAEQFTPPMRAWAIENKQLLVRNRELIIWRVVK